MKRLLTTSTLLLVAAVTLLWAATTTTYNQQFASGHGWTWKRTICTGSCTPADGGVLNVSSDGNPAPSIAVTETTKNATHSGYYKLVTTWVSLGVPAAEYVQTVDGSWDAKRLNGGGGCSGSSTQGMRVYDGTDSTEVTTAAVEQDVNVSGASTWTNKNATSAVAVQGTYAPSNTPITLRFNMIADTASSNGSTCEVRGDNYKLVIVSATASGHRHQTVVGFLVPQP